MIGVLILIHQHVLVALLVTGKDIGSAVEHRHRSHDQVVEVERVVGVQQLLILLVDTGGKLLPIGGDRFGVLGGGDQLVLGLADYRLERAGGILFAIQLECSQRLLEDAGLVVIVVDSELTLDACGLALAAENAYADAVESTNRKLLGALVNQVVEARFHLAGGFVGEGYGEDIVGVYAALGNEVSDAMGKHPRLAAARPGQDQHRPISRFYRLALGRVEACADACSGGQGAFSQN